MVQNKALKSKSKARKTAVSTKKATKLPVMAPHNGENDSVEPQDDAIHVAESSTNGKEPNLILNNQQASNEEVQPNGSKSDEIPETAETVKSQRKKTATGTKTEIVDSKEEKSVRSKRQQKKEKENKMEIDDENQPVPEEESASTKIVRKRKAPEDLEDTEQDEESIAVAGPSIFPNRSLKKRVYSSSKEQVSKATSSTEKQSVSVSKTKGKRQKVVLEIPPVRPIAGKVFVIGENDVGQLGLEGVENKKRPTMLDLPESFVDIAAGGMHSVCLTESGEVITFGCNDEGALGRITEHDDSLEVKPLSVKIPEKVVQISAGDSHSAALTESGHVYLWGNFRSGDGQMGLTVDGKKRSTPMRILNDTTIVKISSGTEHLACLSNEGLIYTLGCGENGQLGRIQQRSTSGGRKGLANLVNPTQVHVGNRLVPMDDVWTGSYNTFLKAQGSGSIYTFGLNNYHQLGSAKRNDDDNFIFFPRRIASFNNNTWLRMNGGQHHSLALDNNGLVYSLGRSDYGRLGLGEGTGEMRVPTLVTTLQSDKCTEISCGNCVSFAVTEEGSVYSWGMGDNYQLGHGGEEDCHVPVVIGGKFQESWKAQKVSGGGQHTLIIAVPKKTLKSDKKK